MQLLAKRRLPYLHLNRSLVVPVVLHYRNVPVEEALEIGYLYGVDLPILTHLLHDDLQFLEELILRIDLERRRTPKARVELEDVLRKYASDLMAVLNAIRIALRQVSVILFQPLVLERHLSG